MRVLFRADSAPEIGLGHFMRCLTLADALKERGAETRFVSRRLGESQMEVLEERGHAFVQLQAAPRADDSSELAHSSWLGVSQQDDVAETMEALRGERLDWLVIDHYGIDARWERAARDAARRILVIDDIADRSHDCDVLLDQNLYSDMDTRYDGKVPSSCRTLLGPRFALLRDEFRCLREKASVRTGEIRRVLVLLSGTDPRNHTVMAVEAVAEFGEHVTADVVIGAQHPARREIERACAAHGFECHVAARNVAQLMLRADLAIGAGGATSWERCCLGVPTICLTLAHNQVALTRGLEEAGAVLNLGDVDGLGRSDITDALRALHAKPEQVRRMSASALALVDGLGTHRVRDAMVGIAA